MRKAARTAENSPDCTVCQSINDVECHFELTKTSRASNPFSHTSMKYLSAFLAISRYCVHTSASGKEYFEN